MAETVAARPHPLRPLLRNPPALFGSGVVMLIVLIALGAPLLPLADPNATDLGRRLLPPLSPGHPLGTDQLGRDLLARLVWGTRVSLAIGVFATLLATVIGTFIGLVAGYVGRWLDNLLMRSVDVLMAFPYLLLALAIVAALGPGLRNAMIAIAIVNIPFFARAVRGVTLGFKDRAFMEAARGFGFSRTRLLAAELFPNVLPTVLVLMTTTVGWMILETAGLSFLGLGAQPPQADLGSLLGEARSLITIAPHIAGIAGLLIFLVVMGINLTGDGLRDLLDPRLASGMPGAGRARSEARPASAADAAPPPLLAVRDLAVDFAAASGDQRVIDGLDLDIRRGEAVGLVGESGSGKTVTALALLGLVPPPGRIRGSVRLEGEELLGAAPRRWRRVRGERIAYIAQDPLSTLDPLFSIGDQIVEVLRAHRRLDRRAARERAVDLLDEVRIPDARRHLASYPHELSGGMRQRVAIAMALANDPDLLIADEATTALDVTTQAQILRRLAALRDERAMALLFITHDLGIVSQVCDRIVVLYAGEIMESAPRDRFFDAARHPYSRGLLACVPRLGEPERLLEPIAGQPAPRGELPGGCPYAPRCPEAIDACRAHAPALVEVGAGHAVRCVHVAPERNR